MTYAEEFLTFIKEAVTPFHAVASLENKLKMEGYTLLSESQKWSLVPGKKYYVTKNGSAIIAFQMPMEGSDLSFNVVASHTDSPNFKVKPSYTLETAAKTLALAVEPYGGMIFSSWLDRPLSVGGRVIVKEEDKLVTKLVAIPRPLCVIPNLAIHQNRSINDGYKYNPAVDLSPLYGAKEDLKLEDLISLELGVSKDAILGMDLSLFTCDRGTLLGAAKDYILAPQIDNLESAYLTLLGFLKANNANSCNVYCSFDNEEVGSGTKQGALSTFLKDVLKRITLSFGMKEEEYMVALAKSFMVSCDNAHAVHPNQPGISDGLNRVYMNQGIVIKTNANQLYTTDATSNAVFTSILNKQNIPYQTFANRSDQRGGSTLGHLSLSQVSIDSVDIGLPQLSMHSAMETAGVADCAYLVDAMQAFFETHLTKDEENNYILK